MKRLATICIAVILASVAGSSVSVRDYIPVMDVARAQTSGQSASGQAVPIGGQSLQVQGLAVSPFLIETDVEPGKAQDKTITLTNTTSQPLPIDLAISDFTPVGSTGQAKFLAPDEKGNPAYTLSSWITIVKQPDFTIAPGQQTTVIFRIQPPLDAGPGTHYGGLLFSYRPPTVRDTVQVSQKVGVLVLARLGQAHEQGAITRFLAEPSGSDQFRFLLSFYNQGNVHLKPKGEVYITNMVGGQVATVPVNRDALIVLPESERLFESTWSSGWRFGRYTATAVIYYGDPKIELHSKAVIWIVPWQRGIVLLAGLLIAIYLLRRFFLWHRRRLLSHIKK